MTFRLRVKNSKMHHNLQIVILLTPPQCPEYHHYKELLPRLPSVFATLTQCFLFLQPKNKIWAVTHMVTQSCLIASPKSNFSTILFDLMFILMLCMRQEVWGNLLKFLDNILNSTRCRLQLFTITVQLTCSKSKVIGMLFSSFSKSIAPSWGGEEKENECLSF